ncbi:ankyrin repeat domain-containing protein SOWAHD [Ambystoma mexicanum]|uniref:ankyrin repeat domain-containing protein SOWAHD n=1 Tax=Ambystoma mexicanum TaxID=8296 RepID=UPI0037E7C69B
MAAEKEARQEEATTEAYGSAAGAQGPAAARWERRELPRGAPAGGLQAQWSPQQSPETGRLRRPQQRSRTERHSTRWHRESLPAAWALAAGEQGPPQVAAGRIPSPGGSISSRRKRLLKEASLAGAGALPLRAMWSTATEKESSDAPLEARRKELAASVASFGAVCVDAGSRTAVQPHNEGASVCPEGAASQGEPCSQAPWDSEDFISDAPLALDPLEHEWMLTVAEGQYDSIIGPLTFDPSLLSWRDFVTGYSAIHWLAKHGKHEDFIQLMQFAEAHGLPVDINARASGGLTPLHIAAMQGHEMLIKVLVGAFGADVHLRDHSGRKAWQYLQESASAQIKELSGAQEEKVTNLAIFNKNNNSRSSKWASRSAQGGDEVDGGQQRKSGLPATISPFINLFRRVKLYLSSEW